MELKIQLTSAEEKDLNGYCKLNKFDSLEIAKKSYLEGFKIEKYGLLSGSGGVVEKEVIKEVIKYVEIPVVEEKEVVRIEYVEVEKPVETIKEVVVEKIVEKIVEKEVPVEVIKEVMVEVPVDRVVEKIVEITKEVPVDRVVIQEVVKEVPVEKIVYITDHEEMKSKIFQKEQEFEEQRKIFSTKTQEMENIFQNEKKELFGKIEQLENTPPKVVEVIKEVEVEKVVEVIKEVPVERIVERIVEKETDGGLKPKIDALQNTVQKLKQDNIEKDKKIKEYEQTIENIQKFQADKKAVYFNGSNLDDKLYR